MNCERIYDIGKIKEYNILLENTFKHIFYLIKDSIDNDAKRKLLREIKYITNSITRFEPVEDESVIEINSDYVLFSIIVWDGYYYYDSLNKRYNYYPECKTYYKMSRNIRKFTLEIRRFDTIYVYTINQNEVILETEKLNEENNLKITK